MPNSIDNIGFFSIHSLYDAWFRPVRASFYTFSDLINKKWLTIGLHLPIRLYERLKRVPAPFAQFNFEFIVKK